MCQRVVVLSAGAASAGGTQSRPRRVTFPGLYYFLLLLNYLCFHPAPPSKCVYASLLSNLACIMSSYPLSNNINVTKMLIFPNIIVFLGIF